ncbi:hypothetical protein NQ117_08970 [Paenibacillus sp. SC116]|uniref:hypothetical protein n=1 Tax=Paenibacillus sp. SC116 TaxID=2968986 RepID=UPI00215AA187|nr:hypothetical protein [Paenibacillus sp. SC116]MCR8843818.1 hypothetical protein [Paenibacillus sp. SC116]
MSTQVCPWCDTEIVWDEVLGPEEECPHCLNELNAYRSLSVDLEIDEDDKKLRRMEAEENGTASTDNKGWSNFGWDEDNMQWGSPDKLKLQESADKLIHHQVDVPECSHCREYMLLAGQETVSGSSFEPHVHEGMHQPLLTAPFKLDVYVCTSCFHVQRMLNHTGREAMTVKLQEMNDSEANNEKV